LESPGAAVAARETTTRNEDLGRLEEALAAWDRAIEIDPRSAGARYNRGILLWLKGDPEGAIASYREAIRLDPDFAEAHFQLGHALMRRGRFQEAVPRFRRGHELGSRRVGWAYRSAEWIEDAERKAKLAGQDSRLD
jgi:tetratricopeptide (TPR) repeat protein